MSINTRSIPMDGEALKSARVSRLLLQSDLASLAGTSPNTIYRLEKGRQNVSLSLLGRIASALTIPASALVTAENKDLF